MKNKTDLQKVFVDSLYMNLVAASDEIIRNRSLVKLCVGSDKYLSALVSAVRTLRFGNSYSNLCIMADMVTKFMNFPCFSSLLDYKANLDDNWYLLLLTFNSLRHYECEKNNLERNGSCSGWA